MCRFPCQRRCVSAQRQPHPNVASNTVEFPGCDWWIPGSATKCCLLPTKPRGKQQPMRPNVPRESSPSLVGPPRQPRVARFFSCNVGRDTASCNFWCTGSQKGHDSCAWHQKERAEQWPVSSHGKSGQRGRLRSGLCSTVNRRTLGELGGFGEELVSCAPLSACPAPSRARYHPRIVKELLPPQALKPVVNCLGTCPAYGALAFARSLCTIQTATAAALQRSQPKRRSPLHNQESQGRGEQNVHVIELMATA